MYVRIQLYLHLIDPDNETDEIATGKQGMYVRIGGLFQVACGTYVHIAT